MKLQLQTTKESDEDILNDETIFPPFRNGHLTEYRKLASFCWKRMKYIVEGPEQIQFNHKIWSFMENHPEFQRDSEPSTLDELRRIAMRRNIKFQREGPINAHELLERSKLVILLSQALWTYDSSFSLKHMVGFILFSNALLAMGTNRHLKYLEALIKGEISVSFALTEISHGSDTLRMRTRATYDPKSQEFILHTPDFEAAKCWAANLGKTCTHALVYAQLYTAEGSHHGLCPFVVPIRDPKTLHAFPGVIVGDMGAKIGLNGLDNGFVMFNNYRISRENLLSRVCDVTPDGLFVTSIKGSKKRMAAQFGALSVGRVNICGVAAISLIKAVTIAVRYSAMRKQFGPDNSDEELPILEYQSQQYRLFPYLATAYALKIFSQWIGNALGEMEEIQQGGDKNVSKIGMEMHALSCAGKSICTWAARDGIQECREACGGHGYLKVARIGDLRNEIDPNCTYEGDNNVLLQQSSNFLVALYKKGPAAFAEASHFKSCNFLDNMDSILKKTFSETTVAVAMDPEIILFTLDWLCAWLLKMSAQRVSDLGSYNKSAFDVRNDSQVFYARDLAIAYGQRNVYLAFYNHVMHLQESAEKRVLSMLLSFYGADLTTKQSGLLYQGGYFIGPKPAELYKEGILKLLEQLKPESVVLVDALSPNDFMLNSALGVSDGNVYQQLELNFMTAPGALERPKWWREVVYKDFLKPKL